MFRYIFSMKAAVAVMMIFAVAIAAATFIENDYGTQTARALVYNAGWFELLLFYFTAIVIYNIFKFKMYKREKWGQLVLHAAFVLIALGAMLTRYVGYEGILHLREGQSSDTMVSDVMVLSVALKDGNDSILYEIPLYLSSMNRNRFDRTFEIDGKSVEVKLDGYLPAAKKVIRNGVSDGKDIVEIEFSNGGMGENIFISRGESIDLGDFILSFDGIRSADKSILYLSEKGGELYMQSPFEMDSFDMKSKESAKLPAGSHRLDRGRLYRFANDSLVFRDFKKKARVAYESTSLKPGGMNPQMITLNVKYAKESRKVRLMGRKGVLGEPSYLDFGDLKMRLSYGAKVIRLPFTIKLDRFELERYPGSMSPSSYSSYVTVLDRERNGTMPYHIYMNHVLDYRGYRFFQSSFDQDEKGSVLSVNHDPGTLPTYIGYLLLVIGFIWSFITPKGRFRYLKKRLGKLQKRTAALLLFAALFSTQGYLHAAVPGDGIGAAERKTILSYDRTHALNFGKLVVQNSSGRMEPLDTLAHQILSKISRRSTLLGMNADQVLLGMLTHPEIYQKMKMIKISHPLLAKKLGLPKDEKYASYDDFFDSKTGGYKLSDDIRRATRKKSSQRDMYDKELIKADERVNVAYMTFNGTLLRIFPKPKDKANRWYAPIDAMKHFSAREGEMIKLIVANYFQNVEQGLESGKWEKADSALDVIRKYQYFYGNSVIPSKKRIEMEIEYNRLNIFDRLVLVYIFVGLILLILSFVNIVKPSFSLKWPVRISLGILALAFAAQTVGLAIRWYIADHAPWSNAYESIIYISWATVLAGFVFAKRSPITLAATSILAGIFLFVAYLNWLDPQITNLVPVLKSYWLMIHVAVITASYGFLGLGALLGIFTLFLFVLRGREGHANMDRAIKELTIINEMALLIGLGLVTVGNFLGGVWANESWGRYWGWDPKETWAAVTILVYAAVVHMRFIPSLKGIYAFNVASVLAYSSVIMTYFGVNYYLSGLHSYAAGDPVPIPVWVWPATASIFILIFLAYKNRRIR